MDILLLQNMSIILITAVIILLIFNKLKLPSMIGLFVTGIALSYFIKSTNLITGISEFGVIFLLFIVGLEFSIEKFSAIKHYAVIGGILQVLTTTIIATLILTLLIGLPINQAIFIGFLVSFSSTAIVMKVMQQKRLNHSLQGRVTLGILIFQDIAVIAVILITPLLAGQTININTLPELTIKAVGLAIILFALAKWFIPLALRDAAKTKNRDLFTLLTLFICMGTTFATSLLGISPELGAFIAGLMISNTEYSHQTLGYMQPFQDVFLSIFFISIGLMIDVSFFIMHLPIIMLLTILVLILNFTATFITGLFLKLPTKTIVSISILLSQIGEFSFVLANEGISYGLMTSNTFNIFLAVSILTMSSTPFLEKITPTLTQKIQKIPYFQTDEELKTVLEKHEEKPLEDHVILVGMGVNGKNMAKACKVYNIPYIIVDSNPIVVEKHQELGLPIIYGNASNESVLKQLKITSAQCIVISASTYDGTLKTVDAAKRLNPDIHIIVRTRYLKNIDEVYDAGADEVIPEEFETSIIMFTRIMDYYNKDEEEITDTINNLRSGNYDAFRSVSPEELTASLNDNKTDIIVDFINVYEQGKLSDFNFNEFKLTITSVIRGSQTITDLTYDFQLEADDIILFTGQKKNINKFHHQF